MAGCHWESPTDTHHNQSAGRISDVILITVDTLRADHVGLLGGDPKATPALDALGGSGVTFVDATAHAPLTLPAHASILTGRYPTKHGVRDNAGFALVASVPTLASLLRTSGYHTAAFVSSYVLRASAGLNRGFDLYDDRFEGIGQEHLTLSSLERRGPAVARDAVAWLASAPHPYFLWVHFYDPHAPYDPPPAFAERFPGRPYDGEIAASDFGVGALLAAVPVDRQSRTIVVATGDHGEGLGDHGESQHGVLLYDSTLHVPLMMRGPGIPAGVRVERQVRHVDILPTVLDLVGLQPPVGGDGESLRPLFDSKAARPSGEAPLSYAESRFGALHFGWAPIVSGRDGRWKFIQAPAPELYDLKVDRSETANRFTPDGIGAAMARAVGQVEAASPQDSTTSTRDADTAERLRSLGYTSGRVDLGSTAAAAADPKLEIARYETYVRSFNEGLAQLETGRPEAAETTFRRLARAFPNAFEAHQYLARALEARGVHTDAVRELDLALTLSPNEAVLYFDSARALAGAGRFDMAFARIAAGRQHDPRSFYGALVEGLVAKASGDLDHAARAFKEALTLNGSLAAAHYEL
ncbi:MAG TPA: sulfatase-like hydrolase/transferase, partial [Vicinamibacterales bacterium]